MGNCSLYCSLNLTLSFMKKNKLMGVLFPLTLVCSGAFAQNTFPSTGNIGVGTLTPSSDISVRKAATGVSIEAGGNPYFGTIGFNRESKTGEIMDPLGNAFQINNGGGDKNLHFQVWSSFGQSNLDALVINGSGGKVGISTANPLAELDVRGVLHVVTPGYGDYVAGQGSYLGWNRSGGGGEVNLVNNKGAGYAAGFAFEQTSDGTAFERLMTIKGDGNVGIGTDSPIDKLSVNGRIRSKEVKVEVTNWPDYVFQPAFKLSTLNDIESFIEANGHLPEVPSSIEVEKNGLSLGEMNKILLKKIEEMTLILINMNKQLQRQETELKRLRNK